MTNEPVLDKQLLSEVLNQEYGIKVSAMEYLSLGFDIRSFSYRLIDVGGTEYFLKLRLPEGGQSARALVSGFVINNLEAAIKPLPSRAQSASYLNFEAFELSLYPYVSGINGWHYALSDKQWREIGKGVRDLHNLEIPQALRAGIGRETFSPSWRVRLGGYLEDSGASWAKDHYACALAELLSQKKSLLQDIVDRAQALSLEMIQQRHEYVCCHGDLHSGNFLIDGQGKAYLVDWDTLSLAPKEKDLMFFGAGIGGMLDDNAGELAFYEGYGSSEINTAALAYFRLERIVQDLVAYCENLLDSAEGGDDRAEMVKQCTRQFEESGVVDIAYRTLR